MEKNVKEEEKRRRKRAYKTAMGRFIGSVRDRFDLGEDNATQEEVESSINKGDRKSVV